MVNKMVNKIRLQATGVAGVLAIALLLAGIGGVQAAITGSDVEPDSLVAGAAGDVVVSFTTGVALSPLDRVVIAFPAGFDVSGATKPTDCTGATGNGFIAEGIKTLGIDGQNLTLTYDGDILDIWETGAKTCTIGNITNPTAAGSTGTYAIETKDSLGDTIEGPVTVAADTIVADVLASVVLTSAPAATDADSNVTFVAEGRDQYSNPTGDAVTYSIDSGSGAINGATGVFTPNQTGTTVINASAGGFWATASISVSAGAADSISFVAAPTSTDTATAKTFVADVLDANLNPTGDAVTYVIDSGSGAINDTTGVFTPNQTGTTVIKAASGVLSVLTNISVSGIDAPSSSGGDGDGGSGGGGGLLPSKSSYGPATGEAVQSSPQKQSTHYVEMRKGAVSVITVTLDTDRSVVVTVNTYDGLVPDLPPGYQPTNVHFDVHVEPEANVTGAVVELDAIDAAVIGYPPEGLVILHKVGGQWTEVETEVREQGGQLWVTFETPSFSEFTLANKEIMSDGNPAPAPAEERDPGSGLTWSSIMGLAAMGVVFVIMGLGNTALRRRL